MSDNVFTIKAGVVLPLLQGLVHGGLVGLLTWAGCVWQSWPVVVAVFTGGATALIMFSLALGDWRRAAGYKAWPVMDLQGRQFAQEVQKAPNLIRVELQSESGHRTQFVDLPCTHEQLTALARGLLDGAPLSEAMWTGSGRVFTRAEFSALRVELIRRGLARWNSPGYPARGAMLSPAGRAVCKRIVSGG